MPKAVKSRLASPDRVEDPMANIATVFGWTPPVMDAFGLLMDWRERARVRAGAQ